MFANRLIRTKLPSSASSIHSSLSLRAFSTEVDGGSKKVLLYEGKYGKKMGTLRKISLGSSLLSFVFLPIAATIESGVMPLVAQMALAGTVLFTSTSSTALLHAVGNPYVTELFEMQGKENGQRVFEATRLTLLGKQKITRFTLNEAQKSAHPFASFKIPSHGDFYIYGGGVTDVEVKEKLSKE